MSYFEDASLVYIPSAVKNAKTYSIKPTDGSGDLTFSRASNATRVNSSGLVEKVRTNLAFPSENFSAWTQKNGATTINTTANPIDGAITADTFVSVAQVGQRSGYELPFSTAVGELTASNYFKYVNNQWIFLAIYDTNNATYRTAAFDIQNGVAGVKSSGVTSSIISVGGGWYRCSITYPITSSTTTYHSQGILNGNVLGVVCNTSGGESFISFGAQYENGVTTDYIATTSAAVSVGPVSGLPRLDYSGGATCGKLLLEPQCTALLQYSESFDNAYWTKARLSVSANTSATLDPSGYYGADKLVEDSSTSTHEINHAIFAISALPYTYSIFAKAAERSWIALSIQGQYTFFDVANGAVGVNAAGNTAKIESYGNGWYRCSITRTATAANNFGLIRLASADNTPSYAGDGTSGLYVWGANLTQTGYVQSYIPTLGASVTRLADAAYKTGISSLIGQTEGTLYWEGYRVNSANFGTALVIDDTTTTNRIYILTTIDGFRIDVTSGGTSSAFYTGIFSEGTHKIAVAYNSSAVDIYIDGVSVYNDTSVTIPACSRLVLGNWSGNTQESRTSQALLFKTRLSNADLATLTA